MDPRSGENRSGLPLLALAAVAAVAAVVVGSLVPGPTNAPTPGAGVAGIGVDKLLHAGGYATIALLVAASRRPARGVDLLAVVVAVATLGAGIEVLQLFVPGRTTSAGDAVANTVGAALGVGGWRLVRWWSRRTGPASSPPS
jgi:VanZ family protein